MLTDVLRFPFSLFVESKAKHSNNDNKSIIKVGDVTDVMDKSIGRPVIKISGALSMNNHITYDKLHLTGRYVYIQLHLLKTITTFHIEFITSKDTSIRLTLSTIYANEKPRDLGTSIRLPLPVKTGWMVIELDMNQVIEKYLLSSAIKTGHEEVKFKAIKKIQLCSSMLVRDIVTSDKPLSNDLKSLIKELAIKSQIDGEMTWINITTLYPDISSPPTQAVKIVEKYKQANKIETSPVTKIDFNEDNRPIRPSSSSKVSSANFLLDTLKSDLKSLNEQSFAIVKGERTNLTVNGNSYGKVINSPAKKIHFDNTASSPLENESNMFNSQRSNTTMSTLSITSPCTQSKSIGKLTPSSVNSRTNHSTPPSIVRLVVPDTNPADKVLSIDRMLGYSGGASLLLYNGKLLVLSSGSLIVLIDVEGNAQQELQSNKPGLWRAFRSNSSDIDISPSSDEKYKQAFLKGHSLQIGILEACSNFKYMATCETSSNGLIIIWDLVEGKRVAALKPHCEGIISVAFSNDLSIFVTVGIDTQRRVQIIAWDFQLLLLERGVVQLSNNTKKPSTNNLVIAKQLSDFPINEIYFSPFEECGLVSCGRENVRFWRLKKGHMPGRPIMLNEHSRGYIFNKIVFLSEVGLTPKEPKKQVMFVSTNKGMLLKIDCEKEQVLCSYQLHSGSIMSLSLRNGFAVTGGEDSKLRVWPLDFSDFLLEAHHEAAVTNIHIDNEGTKLCVGTAFGTLGILDVSEHSYSTILRSHVGKIIHVASRSNAEEFVTLGDDNTIRLWDAATAQQKFEFTSPSDSPLCAAYHPINSILSCGFGSGSLRVFDIETTSTLIERKVHAAPIVSILYNSHQIQEKFRLYTASLDGSIVVYDVVNGYEPIRTLIAHSGPSMTMRMTISKDFKFIATSCNAISTINIFDANELVSIYKDGHINITLPSTVQTDPSPTTPSVKSDNILNPSSNENAHSNIFAATHNSYESTSNAGSSQSAVVSGIAFSEDKAKNTILLVTTDKHVITLPIDTNIESINNKILKKKRTSIWDERSVKRVEFGTPVEMIRDPATGLMFMSVISPSSTTFNKKNTVFPPDSLVIVDASHRSATSDKLTLSSAQMYIEHPGSIIGIASLMKYGKAISIDDRGCIVIWNINHDRLIRLQNSIHESLSPSTHENFNNNDNNNYNNSINLTSPMRHIEKARGLTSDFENAVNEDQTLWSKNNSPAPALLSSKHDSPAPIVSNISSSKQPVGNAMNLSPVVKTDSIIDDNHLIDSNHLSNELKLADMMIDSIETFNEPVVEISNVDLKKTKEKLINSFNNIPIKGEDSFTVNGEGLMQINEYATSPELSKALLKSSSITKTIPSLRPSTAPSISNQTSIKSDALIKPQVTITKTKSSNTYTKSNTTMNSNSKSSNLIKSKSTKDSLSKVDSNSSITPSLSVTGKKSSSLNKIKSAWKETTAIKPRSVKKDTNWLEVTKDEIDDDLCVSDDDEDDDDDILNEDDHNSLRNSIQSLQLSVNNGGISCNDSSILIGEIIPKSVPFQYSIDDDLIKNTRDDISRKIDKKIETLCQQYSVEPSLCQTKRKLVNCDGDMINIKSLDGDGDVLLYLPYQYKEKVSNILHASISPSGTFIVAIVKHVTDDSCYHSLVIWSYDRDLDSNLDNKLSPWCLIDTTVLQTSQIDHVSLDIGTVAIEWLLDDSVIIGNFTTNTTKESSISSMTINELYISILNSATILSCMNTNGRLERLIKQQSHLVGTWSGGSNQIKALPGQTYHGATNISSTNIIAVIVWCGSKISLEYVHLKQDVASELVWTDNAGPKGPFIALDIITIPPSAIITSSSLSFNTNVSLMVALDSYGGVRFTCFYSGGILRPCSVDAKIIASHVGGSPISVALSMGLDNKSNSNKNSILNSIPCLILGSTSSIRTFSIILKQKTDKHLAINLTNLSKIPLSFEPNNILPLFGIFGGNNICPPSLSNKLADYHIDIPDILVTSKEGDLAVILYAAKGEKKTCLLIQSPVLKHTSSMKMTSDDNVLCLLNKGIITFSNSVTGVKLSNSITLTHVSCISTSNDVIAIGFNNGKVELIHSKSMQLLRVVTNINTLAPIYKINYKNVSSSIQSLESLKEKDYDKTISKVTTIVSVSCLLFICNGEILVIAYSNGTVSISSISTGNTIEIPNSPSILKSNSSSNVSLIDCVGDVNIFGIIRQENEIELITVSTSSSLSFTLIDHYTMFHDSNKIKTKIIHLIRQNHMISINIIANVISNCISTSSILSSSINLTSNEGGKNNKIINLIPRINLGLSFNTNSFSFYNSTCAVALNSGIYLIDLNELNNVCTNTELLSFEIVKKICKPIVSLDNSSIGSMSWKDAVLNISNKKIHIYKNNNKSGLYCVEL